MVLSKTILFCFLIVFCCHCTTTPPPEKPRYTLPKSQATYKSQSPRSHRYNDIDVNALMQELDMDSPIEAIGFQENAFNTCQIRSNRSKAPLCQKLYLGRLNFQVMCRQSTGTVEKVHLTPLNSEKLKWKKGGKRGKTATNASGFGSLSFVTRKPSQQGHLYLYLGSKIARKRLKDRWKLILPQSWCRSQ